MLTALTGHATLLRLHNLFDIYSDTVQFNLYDNKYGDVTAYKIKTFNLKGL